MNTIIKSIVLAVSIGSAALALAPSGVARANEGETASSEEAIVVARRGGVAVRRGYSTGYVGGYSASYGYRAVGGVGIW